MSYITKCQIVLYEILTSPRYSPISSLFIVSGLFIEYSKLFSSETSLDTVKTLLAYGYIIEPPVQDTDEGSKKHNAGKYSIYVIVFFHSMLKPILF